LTSVLSFLSLSELAAVLSVNKEWSAAVLSMRPSMLTAHISDGELDALLSSRLRRHVAQVGQWKQCKLTLRPWRLPDFARALPQLRSLSMGMGVSFDDDTDKRPTFPPQLQRLHVRVFHSAFTVLHVLSSIDQLQQLHTLSLVCFSPVSLSPLRRLPLLRNLDLRMELANVRQSAADLRALHWLHRLHIDVDSGHHPLEREVLVEELLCNAPGEDQHTMQWRDFALTNLCFTDELTPLLLRLPFLECLVADCRHFAFLSVLPRLTQLTLYMLDVKGDSWSDLLAIFTADGLMHLRTLALHYGPYTSDDLCTILSHTPALTSLTLVGLAEVLSLSFFHLLPQLAETLTDLTLQCTCSWQLTAAHLPPLQALRHLRELRLLDWPHEAPQILTIEDRTPFEQRPCSILPHLEVFEWTIRRHRD
jgi:hypothetical protein